MTPLPVVEERCGTCRFRLSKLLLDPDGKWRPSIEPAGLTEAEYEATREDSAGECVRYPPITSDGHFPDTYLDNWCGEWQPQQPPSNPILSQPVEVLGLSNRAINAIKNSRFDDAIETVAELIQKSRLDLMAYTNFGETSLRNVRQRLAEHGLKLKGDP